MEPTEQQVPSPFLETATAVNAAAGPLRLDSQPYSPNKEYRQDAPDYGFFRNMADEASVAMDGALGHQMRDAVVYSYAGDGEKELTQQEWLVQRPQARELGLTWVPATPSQWALREEEARKDARNEFMLRNRGTMSHIFGTGVGFVAGMADPGELALTLASAGISRGVRAARLVTGASRGALAAGRATGAALRTIEASGARTAFTTAEELFKQRARGMELVKQFGVRSWQSAKRDAVENAILHPAAMMLTFKAQDKEYTMKDAMNEGLQGIALGGLIGGGHYVLGNATARIGHHMAIDRALGNVSKSATHEALTQDLEAFAPGFGDLVAKHTELKAAADGVPGDMDFRRRIAADVVREYGRAYREAAGVRFQPELSAISTKLGVEHGDAAGEVAAIIEAAHGDAGVPLNDRTVGGSDTLLQSPGVTAKQWNLARIRHTATEAVRGLLSALSFSHIEKFHSDLDTRTYEAALKVSKAVAADHPVAKLAGILGVEARIMPAAWENKGAVYSKSGAHRTVFLNEDIINPAELTRVMFHEWSHSLMFRSPESYAQLVGSLSTIRMSYGDGHVSPFVLGWSTGKERYGHKQWMGFSEPRRLSETTAFALEHVLAADVGNAAFTQQLHDSGFMAEALPLLVQAELVHRRLLKDAPSIASAQGTQFANHLGRILSRESATIKRFANDDVTLRIHKAHNVLREHIGDNPQLFPQHRFGTAKLTEFRRYMMRMLGAENERVTTEGIDNTATAEDDSRRTSKEDIAAITGRQYAFAGAQPRFLPYDGPVSERSVPPDPRNVGAAEAHRVARSTRKPLDDTGTNNKPYDHPDTLISRILPVSVHPIEQRNIGSAVVTRNSKGTLELKTSSDIGRFFQRVSNNLGLPPLSSVTNLVLLANRHWAQAKDSKLVSGLPAPSEMLDTASHEYNVAERHMRAWEEAIVFVSPDGTEREHPRFELVPREKYNSQKQRVPYMSMELGSNAPAGWRVEVASSATAGMRVGSESAARAIADTAKASGRVLVSFDADGYPVPEPVAGGYVHVHRLAEKEKVSSPGESTEGKAQYDGGVFDREPLDEDDLPEDAALTRFQLALAEREARSAVREGREIDATLPQEVRLVAEAEMHRLESSNESPSADVFDHIDDIKLRDLALSESFGKHAKPETHHYMAALACAEVSGPQGGYIEPSEAPSIVIVQELGHALGFLTPKYEGGERIPYTEAQLKSARTRIARHFGATGSVSDKTFRFSEEDRLFMRKAHARYADMRARLDAGELTEQGVAAQWRKVDLHLTNRHQYSKWYSFDPETGVVAIRADAPHVSREAMARAGIRDGGVLPHYAPDETGGSGDNVPAFGSTVSDAGMADDAGDLGFDYTGGVSFEQTRDVVRSLGTKMSPEVMDAWHAAESIAAQVGDPSMESGSHLRRTLDVFRTAMELDNINEDLRKAPSLAAADYQSLVKAGRAINPSADSINAAALAIDAAGREGLGLGVMDGVFASPIPGPGSKLETMADFWNKTGGALMDKGLDYARTASDYLGGALGEYTPVKPLVRDVLTHKQEAAKADEALRAGMKEHLLPKVESVLSGKRAALQLEIEQLNRESVEATGGRKKAMERKLADRKDRMEALSHLTEALSKGSAVPDVLREMRLGGLAIPELAEASHFERMAGHFLEAGVAVKNGVNAAHIVAPKGYDEFHENARQSAMRTLSTAAYKRGAKDVIIPPSPADIHSAMLREVELAAIDGLSNLRAATKLSQVRGLRGFKSYLLGRWGFNQRALNLESRIVANQAEYMGPLRQVFTNAAYKKAFMDNVEVARDVSRVIEGLKPLVTAQRHVDMVTTIANAITAGRDGIRNAVLDTGRHIANRRGFSGFDTRHNGTLIKNKLDEWREDIVRVVDWDKTRALNASMVGEDVYTKVEDFRQAYIGALQERVLKQDIEMNEQVRPDSVTLKKKAEHLGIAFLPGGSAFDYDMKWGSGRTGVAMLHDLARMAKEDVVFRELGSNPRENFAKAIDSLAPEKPGLLPAMEKTRRAELNALLGDLLGDRFPADEDMARVEKGAKGFVDLVALPLSGIQVLGDMAGLASTLRYLGVSTGAFDKAVWKAMYEEHKRKGFQGEWGGFLMAHGVAASTVDHALATLSEKGPILGRLASARESLLGINGLVNFTKVQQAVFINLATFDLAEKVRNIGAISKREWEVLSQAGLTATDLGALHEAIGAIEGVQGDRVDFRRIKDRELREKVKTYFTDFKNMAVLESDAGTKRALSLGLRPGTKSHLAVSLATQYMNIPAATMAKVWGRFHNGYRDKGFFRALVDPKSGLAVEVGAYAATSMVMGYMAYNFAQLAKGEEATHWDDTKTRREVMLKAMLAGGSLGLARSLITGYIGGPAFHMAKDTVVGGKALVERGIGAAGNKAVREQDIGRIPLVGGTLSKAPQRPGNGVSGAAGFAGGSTLGHPGVAAFLFALSHATREAHGSRH